MDEEFVTLMRRHYGAEVADALVDSLRGGEASTSIRLNPNHGAPLGSPQFGGGCRSVPWCPLGRYLDERPAFIADPLLHSGAYYVQEASSMFLWHALSCLPLPSAPMVLDLCASPGGKSTLALSQLPTEALLVCNEAIGSRVGALLENVCKWGHANVVVTSESTEAFHRVREAFDVVVADVPCSGEGMFRKSTEAVSQWSMDKVLRCQALQRKIVADAWACLRPGGYLVYSTCTFNPLEDEQNIDWIVRELGGVSVDLQPNVAWGVFPALHAASLGYHFLPHLTRGEGFFLSVVRKPEGSTPPPPRMGGSPKSRSKASWTRLSPHSGGAAAGLPLRLTDDLTLLFDGRGRLCAFPCAHTPFLDTLAQAGIRPLQVGTPLAEEKGKGRWRPLQPLAHSPLLRREAVAEVPLSLADALAYLRGQALALPPTTPRGLVLATYQGHALGFLNHVGGHANNLYPATWRIQKEL